MIDDLIEAAGVWVLLSFGSLLALPAVGNAVFNLDGELVGKLIVVVILGGGALGFACELISILTGGFGGDRK